MRIRKKGAAVALSVAVAVVGAGAIPGVQLGFGNGTSTGGSDADGGLDIRNVIDSGVAYAAAEDYLFTDLSSKHWASEAARIMTEQGVVNGYEDGSFRPDGKLTYGEFIKMLMIYHTGTDVGNAGSGHWASFYYDEAVAKGLMTEEDIPKDKLSAPITREDMAFLTAKTFENKTLDNLDSILASISDVDASGKRSREIAKVYGFGIITGYEDGSFRPLGELTRAEGVTVMYRLLEETARVYPDFAKQTKDTGTDDKSTASGSSGNGAVSAEKGESGAVPVGSIITTFMDYMPHPFYDVPVIYDENYAEKWESRGEMENPYKSLKYCVVLDGKNTGPDGIYANLSATLTKNLVNTEGITFSDEVLGRRVVLVCGSTAYRMDSYNSKRYWIPETEDDFKLPKYDYVGFFQEYGDTLYLISASKIPNGPFA